MIYWELFWGFLKVGCFTFGGAYGSIPLIRDVVKSYGWLNDEMLTYMIAVSESTPGPIMVNMATYIGSSQGGFLGALLATLAVVMPSFFVILLITALLKGVIKNTYVQAVLLGLKPCVVGIVLATGVYMIMKNCFGTPGNVSFDLQACIIAAVLFGLMWIWKRVKREKFPPILLILISAVVGTLVYGI